MFLELAVKARCQYIVTYNTQLSWSRMVWNRCGDAESVSGSSRGVIMSTVGLNLPESLYKQVCKLDQQDGLSLNQFIATAVAEKAAALTTVEYL